MLIEDDSFIGPIDMIEWSCEQQESMSHFPSTRKEFIFYKNTLKAEANSVETVRIENTDTPDRDYMKFKGISEFNVEWECWLYIPPKRRRRENTKAIVSAALRKKIRKKGFAAKA